MISRHADTISVNPGESTLATRNFIDLEPIRLRGVVKISCPAHAERLGFIRFIFGMSHAGKRTSAIIALLRMAVGIATVLGGTMQLSGHGLIFGTTASAGIWSIVAIVCGILLVTGLMTRAAATTIFIGMVGLVSSGIPTALPYAGMAVAGIIFILGSGRYSADYLTGLMMIRNAHFHHTGQKLNYKAFRRV